MLEDLAAKTSFDPSRGLGTGGKPVNTTNSLCLERKIPVLLMELRVGTGKKLGSRPSVQDRLEFGKQLITMMTEKVLQSRLRG